MYNKRGQFHAPNGDYKKMTLSSKEVGDIVALKMSLNPVPKLIEKIQNKRTKRNS